MTDSNKISKAEEDLLFLFKVSPCPVIDIIDFHIRLERKRATVLRTQAPAVIYVVFDVFKALRQEYRIAKHGLGVPDETLSVDRDGYILFNGVKITPFFSTPETAAKMPHCSLLMIYDEGEFRGL